MMFNCNVMAWVMTIGGILLGGGILYGILDAKLSREKFFNELKSSNFSIDHLMPGSVLVAFDDSKRQVAFVARDGIFKFPTTALDSGPYTGLSAMVSTYQTRFIFASRIRATLSSCRNYAEAMANFGMRKLKPFSTVRSNRSA